MLVSGVPVKIDEHAREMALMALAMLEKVQTLINPLTNMPLELQIGLYISALLLCTGPSLQWGERDVPTPLETNCFFDERVICWQVFRLVGK